MDKAEPLQVGGLVSLSRGFHRYFWGLFSAWILVIIGLWGLNMHQNREVTRQRALTEARAHFLKDQAFRFWAASHGGVYVPRNSQTPANPYLEHIPDRDLNLPSGKELTLMNPAYMVRQMNEGFADMYGVVGHITSTRPLRPGNAPDAWETAALEAFEAGQDEVMEFTEIEGEPYLRLMQPMVTKDSCLKCHAHQGYALGDIRGGVAVALPMESLLAGERANSASQTVTMAVIMVLGMLGLLLGRHFLQGHVRERDAAMQELWRAHELLQRDRDLFLQGPVVVFNWRHAPGWPTEYVSGNVQEVLGYSDREFIHQGLDFGGLVHAEDRARVEDEIAVADKGGLSRVEHTPFRLVHKEGRDIWMLVHTMLVRDEAGVTTHVVGYMLDISEMKGIEEQLVRHERLAAVGQLSAGVAHDFNNILTFVMGNAELVQETPGLPREVDAALQTIQTGCRKAAHLVRQILDFSQKTIYRPRAQDLRPLLQETLSFLRSAIPENVRIELDLPEQPAVVGVDPNQLHQVLTNLAVNASKAMPEGGILSLQLRSRRLIEGEVCALCGERIRGDWWELQVRDSGCGMAPSTLGRIFEPFFTTREVGEGSGLGLSQVAGIVAQHGGHVQVASLRGEGTVFRIFLPSASAEMASEGPTCILRVQRGEGRVLLVEDNHQVREALQQLLDRLGYEVKAAVNGEDALALFRASPGEFRVVLTDMVMPGIGGDDLVEELKALDPDLPIVMMSGYPLGSGGREDGAVQADEFLQKPVELKNLSRAMKNATRQGAVT